MVLAILTVVAVASVGGFSEEAQGSGCKADAHTLSAAAESYFAQTDSLLIPATDASADGFEKTLATAGFLRSPSVLHNLDSSGALVQAAGSPCTV